MRKPGHIERRGADRFLVRWSTTKADGQRKQKSKIVVGDRGKALAFLNDQLNAQPETVPTPVRTFGSFLEVEWAQYAREHWKASTSVTMGSMVRRHIASYFSSKPLNQITPETIAAFHRKMESEGLGRKTRRNLHAILSKMFRVIVEDLELTDRNPVKKGLCPRLEKSEKPTLTEPQLAQLFAVVPARYKAFYLTLALTGIRSGEALGLKWEDVDFADRELHIRRAIYRGQECSPKTKDSLRARPMVAELERALLNHKVMSAYTQPGDYVFASTSGRAANPDQLRGALQAALRRMGVRFDQPRADGMHLLRHSSGSIAYRRTGGDLKATQEWLGHSSSRITADVYVHLAKDQQQVTAASLAEGIFRPSENSATAKLVH